MSTLPTDAVVKSLKEGSSLKKKRRLTDVIYGKILVFFAGKQFGGLLKHCVFNDT